MVVRCAVFLQSTQRRKGIHTEKNNTVLNVTNTSYIENFFYRELECGERRLTSLLTLHPASLLRGTEFRDDQRFSLTVGKREGGVTAVQCCHSQLQRWSTGREREREREEKIKKFPSTSLYLYKDCVYKSLFHTLQTLLKLFVHKAHSYHLIPIQYVNLICQTILYDH